MAGCPAARAVVAISNLTLAPEKQLPVKLTALILQRLIWVRHHLAPDAFDSCSLWKNEYVASEYQQSYHGPQMLVCFPSQQQPDALRDQVTVTMLTQGLTCHTLTQA